MSGVELNALNTLGVPSLARRLVSVNTLAQLQALAPLLRDRQLLVLGGGSNVVLGAVIEQTVCLLRLRGIERQERRECVEVTAGAGEGWHELVRWTLGQGLGGLENLALIPGSVGAAPVQNIGAYGVELAGVFRRLTALDADSGRLVSLGPEDCEFGYRTSLFKRDPGRFVITSVTLALPRKATVNTSYADVAEELTRLGYQHPRPVHVAEAVVRIRRRKLPDPRFVPNVGSFFKNPVVDRRTWSRLRAEHADLKTYQSPDGVKLAAAQLIERCDLRGDAADPIRLWSRQPLVLTNPGRRPASEVLSFAARVRSAVEERFGIGLELEPDTFGC